MKPILISLLVFAFSLNAKAQEEPTIWNSASIFHKMQQLPVLSSVLYLAAHPDDENTRLISYFSNEVHAQTAYLSLTRGDGGQNLIGQELREQLGVLRTQELLAARNIDGGRQWFTRANDFGYSKTPKETLKIWDENEVLKDMVWVIRNQQPDIIINRFDHRTGGTTHGHHTASAMLSLKAAKMANDPSAYPEQLAFVKPWKVSRIFFNTSWWFYGSAENFEKADKSKLISVNTGVYYPELGVSNNEIAAWSRSQHRCQGFGSRTERGTALEYLELIEGQMPNSHPLEGINTTWSRVEGGKEIAMLVDHLINTYQLNNPEASIPQLLTLHKAIKKLPDQPWKTIKLKATEELIQACAGLFVSLTTSTNNTTPGNSLKVDVELTKRAKIKMAVGSIIFNNQILSETLTSLEENRPLIQNFEITIPNKFASPYWLEEKGNTGLYRVADQNLIGLPERVHPLQATVELFIDDESFVIQKPISHFWIDPAFGERYEPVSILPKITTNLSHAVFLFSDKNTQEIEVEVMAQGSVEKVTVSLELPDNWQQTPEKHTTSFEKAETKTFVFKIKPPQQTHVGTVKAMAYTPQETFDKTIIEIDYDHIPKQTLLMPSEAKIVKIDLAKAGQKIGYLQGAGDAVPDALKQIGYTVIPLKDEQINPQNLADFDAVVVGIRAFNVVENIEDIAQSLFEYSKQGGTLVLQYNTSRGLKTNQLTPYPISLSRVRIAEENAPVSFVNPDHEALKTPNKITKSDFDGWIQERGLYFPNQWDENFVPLLRMHDQNEAPSDGSLLVGTYGEGHVVYTSLSFFRQLPAGVPGAFRLFANLLSLGNQPKAKQQSENHE